MGGDVLGDVVYLEREGEEERVCVREKGRETKTESVLFTSDDHGWCRILGM